MKSSCKQH